ncbi:unnamed protein product [Pleuronectes platessa]|uniref:Uncharacterized protein n=1 Tax=Pleuronectes platessa TaxID=8262 RepID=A0A9N7ZBT4_PLEPL|nr:unnamed protein product [Pleuronectes platessa]
MRDGGRRWSPGLCSNPRRDNNEAGLSQNAPVVPSARGGKEENEQSQLHHATKPAMAICSHGINRRRALPVRWKSESWTCANLCSKLSPDARGSQRTTRVQN